MRIPFTMMKHVNENNQILEESSLHQPPTFWQLTSPFFICKIKINYELIHCQPYHMEFHAPHAILHLFSKCFLKNQLHLEDGY